MYLRSIQSFVSSHVSQVYSMLLNTYTSFQNDRLRLSADQLALPGLPYLVQAFNADITFAALTKISFFYFKTEETHLSSSCTHQTFSVLLLFLHCEKKY